MKTKLLASISLLIAALFLCLPLEAGAKERSFIVVFHEKPGYAEEDLIHAEKGVIKRRFSHIPAMHVHLSDAAIEKIKKDKRVKYLEEDRVVTLVQPVVAPLADVEYTNAWGVQHIGADVADASGNTGKGVKVAVLDTGIDYNHPDLAANYKGGYNYVETTPPSDPLNPFDDSYNGHGTHVAGIIGAVQNNSGVVGVAPEAELYAVKVMDGGGFGLLSWTIAGIDWAVTNGMNIVNLSFDAGGPSPALQDACDAAYHAGVLLIAASGNTGGGGVTYPAAYSSVIAVSGTDASDALAYFSSVGPEVELAAPGMNIYSTVPLAVFPYSGYQTMSGTSMAAPHVAGTAALLRASSLTDINGDGVIDNVEVRQILRSTANDLGDQGRDNLFGFGLVNAVAASFPTVATGTIIGMVSDATGAAIPGAAVSTDTGGYTTTTSANGTYSLTVSPGTYTVTASQSGYSSMSTTVTVAAGQTVTANITLPVTVTITGSRHFSGDAKTVKLPAGALYTITIANHGLEKVDVRVYSDGVLQRRLSTTYRFGHHGPQEVSFSLDASTKAYQVTFRPFGRTGDSALITISRQ